MSYARWDMLIRMRPRWKWIRSCSHYSWTLTKLFITEVEPLLILGMLTRNEVEVMQDLTMVMMVMCYLITDLDHATVMIKLELYMLCFPLLLAITTLVLIKLLLHLCKLKAIISNSIIITNSSSSAMLLIHYLSNAKSCHTHLQLTLVLLARNLWLDTSSKSRSNDSHSILKPDIYQALFSKTLYSIQITLSCILTFTDMVLGG